MTEIASTNIAEETIQKIIKRCANLNLSHNIDSNKATSTCDFSMQMIKNLALFDHASKVPIHEAHVEKLNKNNSVEPVFLGDFYIKLENYNTRYTCTNKNRN